MFTSAQLSRIMPNATPARIAECLVPLTAAMSRFHIDTPARAAAFIAQIAQESGELRWMQETWGPTAAQKRYEPPSTLATRLGNTQPGDGRRYLGRGPIQLTGRDNYRRFGRLLDLDLEGEPALAAQPAAGFAIAGLYWQQRGLNALADRGDFREITRRINGAADGPHTHLARREAYYRAALEALGPVPAGTRKRVAATPAGGRRAATGTPAATRAAGARTQTPPPASAADHHAADDPSFLRGAEAIQADDAVRSEAAAVQPAGADDAGAAAASAADGPGERAPRPRTRSGRVVDARPDTMDFRDLMYTATLVEVPRHIPLDEYRRHDVPMLDQGQEGACTGYGLATVANFLLRRLRSEPDRVPVSPRMLYALARRYDEWPGQNYEGSSARGAMKGWHKHGVCANDVWQPDPHDRLTRARVDDACQRPLGAYFRVNHRDLVAMHSALAEVGILYATAVVHEGWDEVGADGAIPWSDAITGAHAFAIVAYDRDGFWIQNSWGPGWGHDGFGRISYDDWLANGTDVWVARLGAPVVLRRTASVATAHASSSAKSAAYSYAELRPHIVSVGNDGRLKAGGDYGASAEELAGYFEDDIPAALQGVATPRILLYAHGGLVGESSAVQRVAEYRPQLLERGVYPLAFIWRTDYWTTMGNVLQDAVRRRRPEGVLDAAKDFMLDRFDDALEPLARVLSGRTAWKEMKENALLASAPGGAGERVADHLVALAQRLPGLQIHLVAHSAGSILHGPLISLLAARGLAVETCTLWAPACTIDLFRQHYLPALGGTVGRMTVFALGDEAERDDHCARIYNKSLLYLVSNAFEAEARIPGFRDGVPLLGMQKFLKKPGVAGELQAAGVELVFAPNREPLGSEQASDATAHGGFDDDLKTVTATFARIAPPVAAPVPAMAPASASARSGRAGRGGGAGRAEVAKEAAEALPPTDASPAAPAHAGTPDFHRSESSLREQRQALDLRTRTER